MVGMWCTAVTIAIMLPQIWRVRGGRPVEGLSQLTLLMGQSASFFWVSYGVLNNDSAVIVTNCFVLISQLLVWIALLRAERSTWRNWLMMAVLTGSVAAVSFATTSAIAGTGASILGILNLVPMVLIALRQSDLRGVSIPSTMLLLTANVSWLTYGLMRGDLVIISSNIVIIPMSSIILYRVVQSNRSFRFIALST
jgi:uncharacterized protein with PQ loop repeat